MRAAHVPTEDDELPPYFDTFAVRRRLGTLAIKLSG